MNNFAIQSFRTFVDGAFKPATVLVEDGKISAILDVEASPSTAEFYSLGDKMLIPGLTDTHVHINEPGRTEWEGFLTATQAAAAGGITALVDMPLNCTPVTTSASAFKQKLNALEGKLWVDCGFWGGFVPDSLPELDKLLEAGVLGIKSFTIHSGIDDFPMVRREDLRAAIQVISKHDVPYLIHAELESDEPGEGDSQPVIGESYRSFLESRPKKWENDAIDMMIELAHEARERGEKIKVHIVHLSSAEAIPAIVRAREEGISITTETCPHYLTLSAETIPDGSTIFKCCPPIRELSNCRELWRGLDDGVIELIVSDHSPCTPHLKKVDSGDLETAWGGVSSLQFGLPLVWTEAKKFGLAPEKIIQLMAENTAAFAGFGDRKGKIEVGFDADLVVFDPDAEFVIRPEIIEHRHKLTPYEGRSVFGVVEKTFLKGELVWNSGRAVGEARGEPILRDVS